MSSRRPSFWHRARLWFRRFRLAIWLIVFVVLCALIYLNQVGLPNFIKRPLLARLETQGISLNFSRLRLSFYRGIIAEDVRFGTPKPEPTPALQADEVRLALNFIALLKGQVQVDSLFLREGRLDWPVPGTNGPARALTVDNLQALLRFQPQNHWELERLSGNFAQAIFQASASITNASAIRDWPWLKPSQPTPDEVRHSPLRQLADVLDQIQFSGEPSLRMDVQGDAQDLQTFTVSMLVDAPATETAWGNFARGRLQARVIPARSGALSRARLQLEATEAQTPWASATNFNLSLDLDGIETPTNIAHARVELRASGAHTRWAVAESLNLTADLTVPPGDQGIINGELALEAGSATTRWASGTELALSAAWRQSLTNPVPLAASGRLTAGTVTTAWAVTRKPDLKLTYGAVPAARRPETGGWGFWTNLLPHEAFFDLRADAVQVKDQEVTGMQCAGSWAAPALSITNLAGQLDGRPLVAAADLDVASRRTALRLETGWDARRVSPFLPPVARRWIARYDWQTPPQVQGRLSLVLPAWTNAAPDWRAEVLPTLEIRGRVDAPEGGFFQRIPVSSARTSIEFTDMAWHLPDLWVTRPEGELKAVHRADERTRDYYWQFASTLNPLIARPLLDPKARKVMDLVSLSQPPALRGELWGNYKDDARLGFHADVAVTNFAFRGETGSVVRASLEFTNLQVRVISPYMERGAERLRADELRVDIPAEVIYLTNGFSTADPGAVTRAIGAEVAEAVEPYRFESPPTIRVNGIIPTRGEEKADLYFDVDGGRFHWLRFHLERVSGQVHWAGLRVFLSNVSADYHRGNVWGNASLHFPPDQGTDFQFTAQFTNVVLQAMMADLMDGTNTLEGSLGGYLNVTRGNSTNWPRSDGYGNLTLRDGLIWDIPLFGILSPVLNGIVPGLGNSRASEAAGSFRLTNGVFYSDDLDIRTTGVRLAYRGTLDVDGQTNAKVEAAVWRDVWVVGPIVSTAFSPLSKLFEYRVTGHLRNLKMEPVYLVPKILMLPLRPFKALKDLFPQEKKEPGGEKKPPNSRSN